MEKKQLEKRVIELDGDQAQLNCESKVFKLQREIIDILVTNKVTFAEFDSIFRNINREFRNNSRISKDN